MRKNFKIRINELKVIKQDIPVGIHVDEIKTEMYTQGYILWQSLEFEYPGKLFEQ